MCSPLAYAESGDPNAMNLQIVLGCLFILAATALLAFVLIMVARRRKHRRADLITAAAIFWALLAAGSLLYAGESQTNWSKEYTLRLETGYLDPRDTNDAPKLPWKIWTGLGVAYAVLLTWSLSQKHAAALRQ